MKESNDVEIKRIDVVSVFRYFGGIFFIIGLIAGLFGGLFRIDILSTGIARVFPFIMNIRHGIFAGFVFSIVYGLSAGISISLLALLYNFFAAVFGGLKINLKQ